MTSCWKFLKPWQIEWSKCFLFKNSYVINNILKYKNLRNSWILELKFPCCPWRISSMEFLRIPDTANFRFSQDLTKSTTFITPKIVRIYHLIEFVAFSHKFDIFCSTKRRFWPNTHFFTYTRLSLLQFFCIFL